MPMHLVAPKWRLIQSKLLDIPIHHYVSINMKGLKDLIDAVGGIEVDNTIGEFTLDGITVQQVKSS